MKKSLWTRFTVLWDRSKRDWKGRILILFASLILFSVVFFSYSQPRVIPVIVVGGLPEEDFHGEWRPTSVVPHYAHATIWAAELWRQIDLEPLIIFVNCTMDCRASANYLKQNNFDLREINGIPRPETIEYKTEITLWRYFIASFYWRNPDNTILIMSDADVLPLKRAYFDSITAWMKSNPEKWFFDFEYGHWKGRYRTCYTAASISNIRKLFGISIQRSPSENLHSWANQKTFKTACSSQSIWGLPLPMCNYPFEDLEFGTEELFVSNAVRKLDCFPECTSRPYIANRNDGSLMCRPDAYHPATNGEIAELCTDVHLRLNGGKMTGMYWNSINSTRKISNMLNHNYAGLSFLKRLREECLRFNSTLHHDDVFGPLLCPEV